MLTSTGRAHALAFARRPGPTEFVCADITEVVLPPGLRPCFDIEDAAEVFALLPSSGLLRADAYATRVAVCAALLDFMHCPETGIIVVGQAAVARRASVHAGRPISRATAGRHLRALEREGVLYVAQRGASKFVLRSARHRAPSYVICAPADRLSPAGRRALAALKAQLAAGVDEHEHLPEGVRTNVEKKLGFSHRRRAKAGVERPYDAPLRAARTLGQRLDAVTLIAQAQGWDVSAYTLSSLQVVFSPFLAARWCPEAIVYAFTHLPGGRADPRPLPEPHRRDLPHGGTRIRSLPAVLTARLRRWREADGTPVSPPVAAASRRPGRRRRQPPKPAGTLGLRYASPRGELPPQPPANPWAPNPEYVLARARLARDVADRRLTAASSGR